MEGVQRGDDEPAGMRGERGVHPGECALADLAHDDLDPHVGVPRGSEDPGVIHRHYLRAYRIDAHRSPEGYFRSLTCCGGASSLSVARVRFPGTPAGPREGYH